MLQHIQSLKTILKMKMKNYDTVYEDSQSVTSVPGIGEDLESLTIFTICNIILICGGLTVNYPPTGMLRFGTNLGTTSLLQIAPLTWGWMIAW